MAGATATKHSGETSQLPFPINEEDSGADRLQEKRKKKGSGERSKHFSKFSMTKPRKHKEDKRSLVLKPTRSKELMTSTKARNPWTKAKEAKNGCCTVLKNIAVSAAAGGALALRPGQMSVKVPGKRGRKPKVVPPASSNKGTVLTALFVTFWQSNGVIWKSSLAPSLSCVFSAVATIGFYHAAYLCVLSLCYSTTSIIWLTCRSEWACLLPDYHLLSLHMMEKLKVAISSWIMKSVMVNGPSGGRHGRGPMQWF